jgi:hypothetical protein
MVKRRRTLERDWLDLTRKRMPETARSRGWPIRQDHCFQRVLLDNACGGVWYDHVLGRHAYACASRDILERALALGKAALAGEADMDELNRRSLDWRKARSTRLGPLEGETADP